MNGNVFVAWDGYQAGNYDIYARIFDANGTALSNEFSINQNTTNDQRVHSIASLTNGNVFVAWHGDQTGVWNNYGRYQYSSKVRNGMEKIQHKNDIDFAILFYT